MGGLDWNRIVKRVNNWRLKWPMKLKKYVDEMFPDALTDCDESIMALLEGREEAKDEPMEDVKDEIKSEDVKGFIASATFKGAKPGFVFTTGGRGTGYYPDTKKEKKVKKEEVKEIKEEPIDIDNWSGAHHFVVLYLKSFIMFFVSYRRGGFG